MLDLSLGDMFLESNLYNLAEKSFLKVLVDGNLDSDKKDLETSFIISILALKCHNFYDLDRKNYDKDTINIANCYCDLNRINNVMKILNAFTEGDMGTELFSYLSFCLLIKRIFEKQEIYF
jgi:hypothetical protein